MPESPSSLAADVADPEQPDVAEQLWRLWRQSQRPDVGAFLAGSGPLSASQIAAALRIDQRERWQIGERILAETYLQHFPAVAADRESALDLIYSEFLIREKRSEAPDLDEYLRRFPEHGDILRAQIELHRAMTATPDADGNAESLAARPAVPGYEILSELGRGGMGVVYKARQQGLNRLVALKMILVGELADPERLSRFRNEAEAAALLQHPNIVQIHEVGDWRAGGLNPPVPYFSLEFVDGGNLGQQIASAPKPPQQAAELVETLANAIHYAHQRGVVHRDLKPANVLVATDGVPKIADFGLAKNLDAVGGRTQSGTILGTPSYMAPEQAGGHVRDIGPAVDVYALGAILYEMLTGRPPFQAATMLETLELVRSNEPVPPSRLQPKLPRDLQTICLKCLEKDPHKRYASAQDLADDLRRFCTNKPIQARRTGSVERSWRWCRRNPLSASLATFVALLLVFIAVGASLAAFRLGRQRDTAVDNLTRAERAERDATEKLFRSTFAQAQALRRSGQMGQRFTSLETLREAIDIARSLDVLDHHAVELRNEVVACLALTDLRVAEEWDAPVDRRGLMPFDAKLERYVCCDQQGNIRILQVADHSEFAHLPAPAANVRSVTPQLSPDGRFLAAVYWCEGQPPQFAIWELPGPTRVFAADNVGHYAFSADGRLAVNQPDGSITLHDLAKGEQRSLGPDRHGRLMAFRPDGKQLAFSNHAEKWAVQVLDLETGQVVKRLGHPDDVKVVAWSADGRLLAAGCDDRNVHVWDSQEWKKQAVLEGHQKWVTALAFSPAGELLASYAWDGTTRLWDPVSGRQLVSAPGECLRFSPDGRRLAFQRGERLGFWEVADERECRVLHHGRVGNRAPWQNYQGPEGLDFSADGRLLVSAAGDGVRLWDMPVGREIAYLNVGHHEAVLFHPDRARLYTFGRTGLWCWPLRADDRGPGSLRVGPPELLGSPAVDGWFRGVRSGDGQLILAGDHLDNNRDRLFVFPADRPAERTVLGEGFKFARIALSPDGRWAAAGLLDPDLRIKVWDARTGRLECTLLSEQVYVTFSPDGQWLLGGGVRDYRLWKTGSWEPGPIIPRDGRGLGGGPAAFRSDGRVLALARSPQHVQLLDFASLREIATLAAPDLPCIDNWFCFSPDGHLLAVATSSHSIQLWDLGAIGRQLRALGLGCDLLPDSPAAHSGETAPHIRVFQELFEAEHLPVVAAEDCSHSIQDMGAWGRQHWSNGKQLLCLSQKGGYVELQADVPETGRYTLDISFTKGERGGQIEVMLDGKKVGNVFDSFHDRLVPSEKVEFGAVELREGSHRLRFTAVNKNPRSAGYSMAIDCLRLSRERSPNP